jgi:hypothetical protein
MSLRRAPLPTRPDIVEAWLAVVATKTFEKLFEASVGATHAPPELEPEEVIVLIYVPVAAGAAPEAPLVSRSDTQIKYAPPDWLNPPRTE